MLGARQAMGASLLLLLFDLGRFLLQFTTGHEGEYGALQRDLVVAGLLVAVQQVSFTCLVLLLSGCLLLLVRCASGLPLARPWRALASLAVPLVPCLLLALQLSRGGGVARVMPAWLAAILLALVLTPALMAGLHLLERLVQHPRPLTSWLRAALIVAALGLLLLDHAVLRGLYLPLHFLLAAGAVLAAAVALHDGSARPAASGRRLALQGGVAAVGLGLAWLAQAQLPGAHARSVLDGVGARQIARVANLAGRAWSASRDHAATPQPAGDGLSWSGPAPHVIVLSLEAVRAASTSLLGHDRPTTPFLERLGRQSIVYSRAYAPSSKTRFALPAVLYGRDLHLEGRPCSEWRAHESLFSVFRARGYTTLCDLRHSKSRSACLAEDCDVALDSGDREREFLMILEALNADRSPLLAFVHLMETHAPYSGFDAALEAQTPGWTRYERALLAMDRALAEFHAATGAATSRPTLLIMLGDHGEAFGEHGYEHHGSSLHDEQIRVPLLLHGLDLTPSRVDAPVSTQWLFDTLAPLAGRPPHGPTLPRRNGVDPGVPVFARLEQWRAVIDGEWKLMTDAASGARWLFNLVEDPAEQHNRIADSAEVASRLSALLDRGDS